MTVAREESPSAYDPMYRELLEVLRTAGSGLAVRPGAGVHAAGAGAGRAATLPQRDALHVRVFGYGLLAGVVLLVPAYPPRRCAEDPGDAAALSVPLRGGRSSAASGVLGFTAVLLVMTLPAAEPAYALGGTGFAAASRPSMASWGWPRCSSHARPPREQPVSDLDARARRMPWCWL
jgi:hypothetical protein